MGGGGSLSQAQRAAALHTKAPSGSWEPARQASAARPELDGTWEPLWPPPAREPPQHRHFLGINEAQKGITPQTINPGQP